MVPLRLRFAVGTLLRVEGLRFLVSGGHANGEKAPIATAEWAMPRRSENGGQIWRTKR